jgi:hypothetical protein
MRVLTLLATGLCLASAPGFAQAPQSGWIADLTTGCRIWKPAARPNWSMTWSGLCRDGVADGQGISRWSADGHPIVKYEGEYRAGKLNGKGVMTWPDGDRCAAVWRDDKRNGQGVYTWADGDRYAGDYRDDKMTGHGVYSFASGNRYEGEFLNDRFDGQGVKTWTTGERYEGEWRDGKANGSGTLVTRGGTYKGFWSDGCFDAGDQWIAVDVKAASCR